MITVRDRQIAELSVSSPVTAASAPYCFKTNA